MTLAIGAATLGLLSNTAGVQPRLDMAVQYAGGAEPLVELLIATAAWEPIEERLLRIVRERSATLVYGDYDVDGSTSTFMLFRWLRGQRVPCNYFLPSRFKHGYGLDLSVVEQATAQGYRHLIALDCGTANITEIAAASAAGLEVTVIDHHQPGAALPDALLLNPHTSPGLPPLCTAGLVYAIVRRLEQAAGAAPAPDLPELAGLATLADVVPLEAHNWALARLALQRLPETSNLGLDELAKAARLDGLLHFTARQACFSLVPRLNAAGRMQSARLVVETLGSPDRDSARAGVQRLEQLNNERRLVTDRVEAQATQQALDLGRPPGLVLYGPDWHPGVLGIVAARIAERFHCPTVVLSDAPQGTELLAGSARAGSPAVDVLALLLANRELLVSCGGHRQAAGLKLPREALDALRVGFASAAEKQVALVTEQSQDEPIKEIPQLALHDLTAGLENDLWALAPFGAAWAAPRCRLTGCEVLRASYMGADKTHMNLLVTNGSVQARLAAFNQSHLVHQLRPGQAIEPLVEIEPDNWNNSRTVMLRLLALS